MDERTREASGWIGKTLLLLLGPGAAAPDGGGPAPGFGWGAPFPEAPPRRWRWRSRGAEGMCGHGIARRRRHHRGIGVVGVEQISGRSRGRFGRLLVEYVDDQGRRVIDLRASGLDNLDAERLALLLLLL